MKKTRWNGNTIDDLSGKSGIVTGASSGIGFEAALMLARKNMHVILAVRDETKGMTAAERIRAQLPAAKVDVMTLDLAALTSVRDFAGTFLALHGRLDLLVNNAGVMIPPFGRTEDGFELQLGTNHLGHFALTGLLLERMLVTPGARIVNVSSSAHRIGDVDFEDLHWEQRRYNPIRAYGDSKIANLHFTGELSRRLRQAGADIIVTAAHPGWTATELQRHSGLIDMTSRFTAQSPAMGALPTLLAAFDPGARGGEFYGPSGFMQLRGFPKQVQPNPRSQDTGRAAKLWSVSTKLTGVDIDEVLRISYTESDTTA